VFSWTAPTAAVTIAVHAIAAITIVRLMNHLTCLQSYSVASMVLDI
jgi:hypothetical protein